MVVTTRKPKPLKGDEAVRLPLFRGQRSGAEPLARTSFSSSAGSDEGAISGERACDVGPSGSCFAQLRLTGRTLGKPDRAQDCCQAFAGTVSAQQLIFGIARVRAEFAAKRVDASAQRR